MAYMIKKSSTHACLTSAKFIVCFSTASFKCHVSVLFANPALPQVGKWNPLHVSMCRNIKYIKLNVLLQ